MELAWTGQCRFGAKRYNVATAEEFECRGATSAKPLPTTASCYSCHAQNGAVDNTFVQFYPTLSDIAKQKGTFKVTP